MTESAPTETTCHQMADGLDGGRPLPPQSSMLLSVVIPAHNEQENLEPTVSELIDVLTARSIPFEIVVVNDNSSDRTQEIAEQLAARNSSVRVVARTTLPGFGRAIRAGLAAARGDVVVTAMADRSDDPIDVVRYYQKIEEGYDCVFGSRFRKGSKVTKYPPVKLFFNRIVNKLVQVMFLTRFNDLTNAFKAYRREVIRDAGPFSSSHFNITIEMSLSALIRRYNIAEIPVSWYGRTWGASNLRLTQMGRRYLSVLLTVFFEKMLISDDILAERLMERKVMPSHNAALERRIEMLEEEIGKLRSLYAQEKRPPESLSGSFADPAPPAPAVEKIGVEPSPTAASAGDGHAELVTAIEDIYAQRFSDEAHRAWRRDLWKILVDGCFSRWIPRDATVLDFGCGLGEFINAVSCRRRIGADLREGVKKHLDPGVELVLPVGAKLPTLDDGEVDIVFCSNLLEHLPDRETATSLIKEFNRILQPDGRLLILGPNLRYTGSAYWDFFDHILPFTDRSLVEALAAGGFEVEKLVPRFLPYTTVGSSRTPLFLVRWYLRLPVVWPFFGAQFFAVGRPQRPRAVDRGSP